MSSTQYNDRQEAQMKTRKEAEARAMELYPDPHIPDHIGITAQDLIDRSNAYHKTSALRQAFLQCWDEMQSDKQTSGSGVEEKAEKRERSLKAIDEIMSTEEGRKTVERIEKEVSEMGFEGPTIEEYFESFGRAEDGQLRQAAGKIAELETLCAEAMGEMPKEWRDRFRRCLNSAA